MRPRGVKDQRAHPSVKTSELSSVRTLPARAPEEDMTPRDERTSIMKKTTTSEICPPRNATSATPEELRAWPAAGIERPPTPESRPYWLPPPEHLVDLTLADGRAVYLRTDHAVNVVWVTSADLLTLWRRGRQELHLACGTNKHRARITSFVMPRPVSLIAQGHQPIAELSLNEKLLSVGFTNGITRTIWLLAHGARSFPIDLCGHDANAFNTRQKQYVGSQKRSGSLLIS
jgi:hypothetical protein